MVPIDSEFYWECPEYFEKVIMWYRDLVIEDQKEKIALGVVPIDSEFSGEQNRQKNFEQKNSC